MLTARQWKMSPLEVGCGSFSNMLPASSVSSEKETPDFIDTDSVEKLERVLVILTVALCGLSVDYLS